MIFRQSPETFFVEEIPLYEPSGAGEHLYVIFRRAGMSTPFILRALERRLRIGEAEVGRAGNKDRDATAVQTVSLPARVEEGALRVLVDLGAEVISAVRHPHKLRTGKLGGNRFRATIELEERGELALLETARDRLGREGFPNAFGPQRFGDGEAVEKGRLLFTGRRPTGSFRRARFAVSAFQAHIFNRVLALRRERKLYPLPVPGDILKKHATGGQFVAETVDETILHRVELLEISPTGPLPGRKAPVPAGEALALEESVLEDEGVNRAVLLAARAPGARRFLRVPVGNLALESGPGGTTALLSFSLPPGSYATVLLQEAGVTLVKPRRPPSAPSL